MKRLFLFLGSLILVFFNVCYFIFVYPQATNTAWLTYAFMTLAILIFTCSSFLTNGKIYILHTTTIALIAVYLGIELVCGLIFLVFQFNSLTWPFISQFLLLLLFIGIYWINFNVEKNTITNSTASDKAVNDSKKLLSKCELLLLEISGERNISLLKNIIEEIRTSPINSNGKQYLDQNINDLLDKLSLNENKDEAKFISKLLDDIIILVKRRKYLLKTSSQSSG